MWNMHHEGTRCGGGDETSIVYAPNLASATECGISASQTHGLCFRHDLWLSGLLLGLLSFLLLVFVDLRLDRSLASRQILHDGDAGLSVILFTLFRRLVLAVFLLFLDVNA